MNARALILEAWPRKPAAFLQYELELRGHRISSRQSKRIVDTGFAPRALWGAVIDAIDRRMAQRLEQVAECDRQIKLARSQIRGFLSEARMAQGERLGVEKNPDLPGMTGEK